MKSANSKAPVGGWFQRQWDKAYDATGPRSGGVRGRGGEEPLAREGPRDRVGDWLELLGGP